ncbi:MAG: YjgN family protein [Alphaproteobacteria bacterium]
MATDTAIEDNNLAQSTTKETNPQKKMKINPLQYEGMTGKVYRIWLMNFFMKIITLGIYSFWGKTKLRKYIYGSFSLGGDRFEYTGTGGELFKGFLKVLPILVVLFGPIAIWGEQYPAITLLYLPILYLFGVAVYSALRYRLSRTRWRGIRGRLGGSAFKYANIAAVRFLINIVTIGFAIPHSDIAKTKYMFENLYFGNIQAEYKGDVKRIYGAFIKSIFMMIGVLMIPGILFAIPIVIESMNSVVTPPHPIDFSSNDAKTFGEISGEVNQSVSLLPSILASLSYLLGIILFILLLPVSHSMYKAALMREQMRGLVVGDLRFKSKVTTWSLLKHQLGNVVWLLFTLGLATPVVIQRKAKFMAGNTIIGGDLDTSQVMQSKDEGIKSGEGLEDALDIDAGFF